MYGAKVKTKKKVPFNKQSKNVRMFLMILPFLVLLFLFSYLPLYGWTYAFFDYRPPKSLSDCAFVGLDWFKSMVGTPEKRQQLWEVLRNTFVMSGLGLFTAWLPMAFAILLSELGSKRFKKIVQTLTTIPNFISWVLVFSIAFSLFSSSGMANNLLQTLGITEKPIQFLQDNSHTWLNMWLWGQWKGLGWGAIMYLAAISGIDQELYEAAKVDGAGRFRLIWHIRVPCLLPTFFVLLIMNVANFLNNGMDQYLVFQNAFNTNKIQVLDLYVYNLGIKAGNYSLATAISMLKSIISISLLFCVNGISKITRGESIV